MKKYCLAIKKYLLLEILLDILATCCLATGPIVMRNFFDGLGRNTLTRNIILIAVYALVYLLNSVFQYLCMIFTWKGAIKFEKDIKRDFIRSLFRMDRRRFFEKEVAEYISLQANDITALEQDYLQPVTDIIRSANMIMIYGITMVLFLDWRITLVVILVSTSALCLPNIVGKKTEERRSEYLEQVGKYVTKITDYLGGINAIDRRTIDGVSDDHENELNKVAAKRYRYGKNRSLSLGLNDVAIQLVRISTFICVVILMITGNITVGIGIAAFGYTDSYISPIDSLLYDFATIRTVSQTKTKVMKYVENEEKQKDKLEGTFATLSVSDLAYSIDNFAFGPFSKEFISGKKYAIVGKNGCGKSTLLKLIMGFLQENQGTIEINGKNIRAIDLSDVVTYVAQNEHVFATDFQNNITMYGSYDYSLLNTLLSDNPQYRLEREDCNMCSGGEKQIISFLRMWLRDSSLILLDEPFSALDIANKDKLYSYLLEGEYFANKTIIMVIHESNHKYLESFDEVIDLS